MNSKKIIEHKAYIKAFNKLPLQIQKRALEKIKLFKVDRLHSSLKDHPLIGNMQGRRSFSVTGDYRIIYKEEEQGIVFLFLNIGKHGQDIYR